MTRIVLDTSALTAPVQHGVRLFESIDRLVSEPEPLVPEPVVTELDGLANDRGEAGTAAAVGRDLVDRCRVVETEATYADDAVVELATRATTEVAIATAETAPDERANDAMGGVAVTNDAALRDRLLARGVRVIGLRGGNTLGMTEP